MSFWDMNQDFQMLVYSLIAFSITAYIISRSEGQDESYK